MKLFTRFLVGFVLPLAILGAGAGVLIAAGIFKREPKKEVKERSLPRVEVAEIEAYDKGLSIDVDGSVVPFRQVTLTSEVAGRIKKKVAGCRAGNYVKAGTLLFEVDPIDYDLEVQRLTKEVRQAEINVHGIDVKMENTRSLMRLAEEDIRLQKNEVNRLQGLVAENIVSETDLDAARRAVLASTRSLEELKNTAKTLVADRAAQQATMDLAGTRLEKAQIDLGRTKIVAPIDGVIVQEMVEEDAFVQKGAQLVEIEDTSAVEVQCELKMDQLYLLWSQDDAPSSADDSGLTYALPNAPAEVVYKVAGREFVWQGRLARYDGIGLSRNRTVPCRILVENPRAGVAKNSSDGGAGSLVPPALVRNMYVTVSIQLNPNAQFARIPVEALKPGNRIWRVNDGRLQIEEVRVARMMAEEVLLEPDDVYAIGDQVVITPLPAPATGLQIRVAGESDVEEKTDKSESVDDLESAEALTANVGAE